MNRWPAIGQCGGCRTAIYKDHGRRFCRWCARRRAALAAEQQRQHYLDEGKCIHGCGAPALRGQRCALHAIKNAAKAKAARQGFTN